MSGICKSKGNRLGTPIVGTVLSVGMLLLSAGCEVKPELPLVAPSEQGVSGEYRLGDPGGNMELIKEIPASRGWEVQVSFLGMEKVPNQVLEPLGSYAQLIAANRGGNLVLPTSRLTADSRFGVLLKAEDLSTQVPAVESGRVGLIQKMDGVLLPGVKGEYWLRNKEGVIDPISGEVQQRGLQISVYYPMLSGLVANKGANAAGTQPGTMPTTVPTTTTAEDQELELAIGVEDAPQKVAELRSVREERRSGLPRDSRGTPIRSGGTVGKGAASDDQGLQPLRGVERVEGIQREYCRVKLKTTGVRQTYVVVVPFEISRSLTKSVMILVTINKQPELSLGWQERVKNLKIALGSAATQSTTTLAIENDAKWGNRGSVWAGIQVAGRGLAVPSQARAAGVYLCNQAGTELCQHVILVADEALLKEIVGELQRIVGEIKMTTSLKELGWQCDLAALKLLSKKQIELQNLPRGRMSDELAAVLAAFAGEPARHSDSLSEIVRGVKNREDLMGRLQQENMNYLEDSAPGARVRAFDWLQTHRQAPAGYDPLGTREQRRAALDKAASSQP